MMKVDFFFRVNIKNSLIIVGLITNAFILPYLLNFPFNSEFSKLLSLFVLLLNCAVVSVIAQEMRRLYIKTVMAVSQTDKSNDAKSQFRTVDAISEIERLNSIKGNNLTNRPPISIIRPLQTNYS